MNDNSKIGIKILVVVLAVIALVIGAWVWGLPKYRHSKETNYLAQAQGFYDHGDLRNALLCARLTLQINSNNVPACRIMAEIEDTIHSPATLDGWRRVVELSPATSNKLALATAGLRYQSPPYPLTMQILEDLSHSASQDPAYYIVFSQWALAMHRLAEAEVGFESASRLDPTNQLYQLNMAVMRVGSTNPAVAADALAKLKQFSSDKNLGPPALRSLIADRLLHDDAPGALTYSTRLLESANATFSDQLQRLSILKLMQSSELPGQLASMQRDSVTNGLMTDEVASWMAANGLLTDAIHWLNHLPENLQSESPVRLALADCYLSEDNWQQLRDFASKDSWGEAEFIRQALLSRAWGKLDEPLVADADWDSAVNLAGNQLGALNTLLELATKWKMKSQQEDLLWRILRIFPDGEWAQSDLAQLYINAGNTRGLYRLYSEQLSRAPQNLELEDNAAFTALLLKTNLNSAYEQAAKAYAQATNNPSVVSTYAYALHLQGKDKHALAVLQTLDKSALEEPSVALYYGVLLSATGNNSDARFFLQIAQTKGRLLPEEKQLLIETLK